jgi:hypothetical protein
MLAKQVEMYGEHRVRRDMGVMGVEAWALT